MVAGELSHSRWHRGQLSRDHIGVIIDGEDGSVSMASVNRRRPRAGSHSDPKHVSDNRWVACSNHAPYLNTRLEVFPPAWGYSTCEIRAAGPEAFGVARRPR